MSNYFSTFDNPYAVMAQGAYSEAPIRFPFDNLRDDQKQRLSSDKPKSVPFDFSKSVKAGKNTYLGGRYYSDNPSVTDHPDWPKNGVVYLQPDPRGRMSDPLTGFNAYYLTDTPKVDGTTTQAYFAVETNAFIVRATGLIFLCSIFVLVV